MLNPFQIRHQGSLLYLIIQAEVVKMKFSSQFVSMDGKRFIIKGEKKLLVRNFSRRGIRLNRIEIQEYKSILI